LALTLMVCATSLADLGEDRIKYIKRYYNANALQERWYFFSIAG
jgi:hypothetical protein